MDTEKRKKLLLLWISVLSISLLVLIVWIFNMRLELQNIREQNDVNNGQEKELEELKSDFSEFFDKLNKEVKNIKDSEQTDEESKDKEENDDEDKNSEDDNNLDNNNNLDNKEASSTNEGVEDVNKSGCPDYVNCMPTIGESVSCTIPPGCEGITIPVY